MITINTAKRIENDREKIYTITIEDVFTLFLEDQEIEIQYVSDNDFVFPRSYKENSVLHLCDKRVVLFLGEWFLLDKKPKQHISAKRIQKILQKQHHDIDRYKSHRKKLLMSSRTLDELIQLSNQELAQTIHIYIEKFENFYPFEPEFTFETTQKGYLRSIEYVNKMFEAKLDIPRDAKVMTENVLFQRSKAIDIVLRYYKFWRYFHDVVYYVQKHPDRMKNIDWEIENQDA